VAAGDEVRFLREALAASDAHAAALERKLAEAAEEERGRRGRQGADGSEDQRERAEAEASEKAELEAKVALLEGALAPLTDAVAHGSDT
jgi:hypothetical protein